MFSKKKKSLDKSNSFSNISYSRTSKQSNISANDSNNRKKQKKRYSKQEDSDSDIENNKSNEEIEMNSNLSETSSETYSQDKDYFEHDDDSEEKKYSESESESKKNKKKKYSESESDSEEISEKSHISSSESDEKSEKSNKKSDSEKKSDAKSNSSKSSNSKEKPFFIDFKYKKTEKIIISKININVNDPIPLLFELNEYKDDIILSKIEEMSKKTPVIRKIRGDGNCFYRAIGLAWIENLITELNETNWKHSRLYKFLNTLKSDSKFKNCKISKETKNKDSNIKIALKNNDLIKNVILKKFSKILKLSYKKKLNKEKIIDYIDDFIRKMNENPFFDLAIIVLMRNLTYKGFKKLEKDDEKKAFLSDNNNKKKEILLYEQEAESIMIDSIAKELKIKIVINILDKKDIENKFPTETYLGSKKKGIPEIHLYFRPGHYDICYLKEYAKTFYNSIYKS